MMEEGMLVEDMVAARSRSIWITHYELNIQANAWNVASLPP